MNVIFLISCKKYLYSFYNWREKNISYGKLNIYFLPKLNFCERTIDMKWYDNSTSGWVSLNSPTLSAPRNRDTSTAWSCHPDKYNWIPSRDFDPEHKTKLSLSSDRRSVLLSRPRQPLNRLRTRVALLEPVVVSNSVSSSQRKKIKLWALLRISHSKASINRVTIVR